MSNIHGGNSIDLDIVNGFYLRGDESSSYGGIYVDLGILDRRSFGEKLSYYGYGVLSFGSDIMAPFMEVPQDIAFPIINQFIVILNHAFYAGRVYDSRNYVLHNTYQFKSWRFEKGRSTTSSGTPNWEEGKEKIMHTLSVGLAPFTVYKRAKNTSHQMVNNYSHAIINTLSKNRNYTSIGEVNKSNTQVIYGCYF